jgi:hypothetical protein
MKFLKSNIALIISIALAYAIFTTTGEYWPSLIHKRFGIDPDWSATNYKLPILILAFLILPIVRWLKRKIETPN